VIVPVTSKMCANHECISLVVHMRCRLYPNIYMSNNCMQYHVHVTGGGVDYDSGPYNVTFPAGMTSIPFDVPINYDLICEEDEELHLDIDSSSLPSFTTVANPQQATLTIISDDCKHVLYC